MQERFIVNLPPTPAPWSYIASLTKILFTSRLFKASFVRQRYPDDRSRKQTKAYDRRMGRKETEGILRRPWNEVAVYHAFSTASEWVLRSNGQKCEVKTALRKAIGDAVLTPFELYTCLLEVTNLINQQPAGRVPIAAII